MRAEALGGWLFRNRGWLPVPLLLGMVASRPVAWAPGLVIVALGEALRLWAVGHIGLPSRTRGDDVAGLVDTGPYARLRNPLYLGNLLLFGGLGVIVWPWALVVGPALFVYYSVIVRWEEGVLTRRLGAAYGAYAARVPRWIPTGAARPGGWDGARALRSERSTLLAIGVVLGILVLRARTL